MQNLKKVLFVLFLFCPCGFSVEMENCGGELPQHIIDMFNSLDEYPECFWEPSSNTLGIFIKNEDMFAVVYDHDAMTVCLHEERNCPNHYYGCAKLLSNGYETSFCLTRKKAREIKERLKKAKYIPKR